MCCVFNCLFHNNLLPFKTIPACKHIHAYFCLNINTCQFLDFLLGVSGELGDWLVKATENAREHESSLSPLFLRFPLLLQRCLQQLQMLQLPFSTPPSCDSVLATLLLNQVLLRRVRRQDVIIKLVLLITECRRPCTLAGEDSRNLFS